MASVHARWCRLECGRNLRGAIPSNLKLLIKRRCQLADRWAWWRAFANNRSCDTLARFTDRLCGAHGKPPGCKQQAETRWAIGQRVGCRNVTLRRAGRIITRVTTPKPLGEGAAFRPGVDPDNPRRCLHELFETTDHRLSGSARTNHRHSLHRRRLLDPRLFDVKTPQANGTENRQWTRCWLQFSIATPRHSMD